MQRITREEEHAHHFGDAAAAAAASATTAAAIDSEPNAATRNLADIDFARYCLATFVLCFTRSVLLHPLFIITTRKQACSISGQQSLREVFRSMRRNERGAAIAFRQGLPAVVLGCAVSETAYNAVYETARYKLERSSSGGWLSVSGAAAGAAAWMGDFTAQCIYCPFSVVAMRQIMHHSPSQMAAREAAAAAAACTSTCRSSTSTGSTARIESTKLHHVLSRLYRHGGVKSFYAGFGLVLLVGGFTSSVFFATYVNLKKLLYGMFTPYLERKEAEMKRSGSANGHPSWLYNSKDNLILNSAASISGSCVAAVILNPYLVVLTRRQSGVAASVREAVTTVYRQHGWRGFYRGAVGASALTTFDVLMASTTYEASMHFSMKRAIIVKESSSSQQQQQHQPHQQQKQHALLQTAS